jgi:hypothetical protein
MIFQKSIHQNFINILISQYEKPSKPFFWESKTSLDRPIFPIKTIEYPSFGMVRIPRTIPKISSPGPSHPPATVAAQNALPLQELPELGVWPRSAPHRVIREFIIFEFNIYIFIFICDYIYICMYIYIYTYK